MGRIGVFLFLSTLILGVLTAAAQEGGEAAAVDEALLAQGEELFQANCAVCHQSSGQGDPPTFPALAGNEALQDPSLIVTNIHEGQGAMPAFRQLTAEEIAALATYVRNAWGNDFGGVSAAEVAARIGDATTLRSVWEGVYTQAQAERGDSLYAGACSECHGFLWVRGSPSSVPAAATTSEPMFVHLIDRADKSNPPVAPQLSGEGFLTKWQGQTVSSMYLFVRESMPQGNPGSLSDEAYIDIIAFLLAVNNIPPGEAELVPDVAVLNDIVIEPAPSE